MNSLILRSLALAAFVGTAPAHADDLPQRKAGLWKMAMQMPGMPAGMESQQCVDAKTDADMQRRGMQGEPGQKCTQKSIKRTAGGVEIEAECTSPEGKTHVMSRASGDFTKAYTVDSKVQFDPPRHGMREASMKITATHGGDCPAGMLPGQVRMAGMPGGVAGPGAPGGRPALPAGIDPKALQGMTPEQLRQMAEEMKKAAGK